MLRRVALVTIDFSEELSASIVRVTRIGELGTTLVCNQQPTHAAKKSPTLVTLTMEALSSFETSVLTRAIRHHISEEDFLHEDLIQGSWCTGSDSNPKPPQYKFREHACPIAAI
jgi:hypothetical protein